MENNKDLQKKNILISHMAFQHKIPIFPCRADKKPLIKDWENNASFEREKITEWIKQFEENLCYWGMPTNKIFALDQDGENLGDIKSEFLKASRYKQKTVSGGYHFLFKNPEGKIRNKTRFTGDFDIRGSGGYIILYKRLFFNCDFNPDPIDLKKKKLSKKDFPIKAKENIVSRLPEGVPEAPKELLDLITGSGYKENKTDSEKWSKGNRNNTLNKELFQAFKNNDLKTASDLLLKAKKRGLKDKEICGTGLSAVKGAINKADTTKTKITSEIIPEKHTKLITPLGFPTGAITIIGGGQGEGKSSAILKACAEIQKTKDKRNIIVFTRENSFSNFIFTHWEKFGGKKNGVSYFTHPDFPKPEMLSYEAIKDCFLKACKSGDYAVVFVDLVYLLVGNELDNKEFEKALLEIQNNLHHSTACVCTAHLKKDIKGQPLLHHFRGGTDLTGIPDRVMYLRRGNNPLERVIVKLKDRNTGDLSGGFIISKDKKEDDMTIMPIEGSSEAILKKYAEPLPNEKQEETGNKVLKRIIRNFISYYKSKRKKLTTEKFKNFIAGRICGIGEKKALSILKDLGHKTKPAGKGKKWIVD